jgi:hypothetical protein
VSQEEADLCAANDQIGNQIDDEAPGPGPVAIDGGHRTPGTLFSNAQQSCSITCPDGTTFTYTIGAGSIRSTSPNVVDTIAHSLACIRANSKQICMTSISGACEGEDYEQEISVGDNVKAPVTWSLISGMLPPGIEVEFDLFNSRVINLAGTPTTAGNYVFVLRATDADGNFMEKPFTLPVIVFTNSPSAATLNTPYSFQFTMNGGTAPYDFTVTSGSLPAGLTMNDSGLISGTPTSTTAATFQVSVNDASGTTCIKEFTITMSSATLVAYFDFDVGGDPVSGTNQFFTNDWSFTNRVTGGDKLVSDLPHGSAWVGTVLGKILNGCELDPSDATVLTLVLPGWNPATQQGFSMFGWFKISTLPSVSLQPLSFYLNSLGGTRPAVDYNTASGKFGLISGATASPPSSIAAFFFLAYTYNNVTGAEVAYFNGASFLTGSNVPFAGATPASALYINGNDGIMDVDEVGFVLNGVLTPAQVASLYNAGAGKTWPAVQSL